MNAGASIGLLIAIKQLTAIPSGRGAGGGRAEDVKTYTHYTCFGLRYKKELLFDIRIRALSDISIWPNPYSTRCQLFVRSECPERFLVMP